MILLATSWVWKMLPYAGLTKEELIQEAKEMVHHAYPADKISFSSSASALSCIAINLTDQSKNTDDTKAAVQKNLAEIAKIRILPLVKEFKIRMGETQLACAVKDTFHPRPDSQVQSEWTQIWMTHNGLKMMSYSSLLLYLSFVKLCFLWLLLNTVRRTLLYVYAVMAQSEPSWGASNLWSSSCAGCPHFFGSLHQFLSKIIETSQYNLLN